AIANDGETILHYAAGYGRLETVKYLVEEKHADIHAIANDGRTILHSAAKCSQAGALEVIKYLVDKKGANINITTSDGKGLSDVASSQVEVIQYLEAKNVNITQDALSSSEAFSDDAVLMGVTD
ncbi:MAG: ankyrin repeat domain-containing protein, partial [Rickettsia endosymbiont of Ixodes ricinus]|nr:ankyrin repeat domain-containing protein [Rickettsia endosymbiont of Ixodes ricinus]